MSSTLVEMFRHNLWANLEILQACRQLEDPQLAEGTAGTYGAIGDTLVHLVAAEQRYVQLLTGQTPATVVSEHNPWPGCDALVASAEESGAALVTVAAADPYGQTLTGTRRGEPYAVAAFIPLLQAINHATEHRSQVMTALTQIGISPPDVSAWSYNQATQERG